MKTNYEIDPKLLVRVRALLAKAESTPYADEALAFNAKAQKLIAQYSIDSAMLGSRDGDQTVTSARLVVAAPYATAKTRLLGSVAQPNRCVLVIGLTDEAASDEQLIGSLGSADDVCTIFGHPQDLELTHLLFTSLLAQATNSMLSVGTVNDAQGRSRTKSFRHSFLLGFAAQVFDRLDVAANDAAQAADGAEPGTVLPVLADRADAVNTAVSKAFPDLGTRQLSSSNGSGFAAGSIAGRTADVGANRFARDQRVPLGA